MQQLCSELRLDNICRNIRNRHKFTYDFHAILTDLIYARILSPSSKMSSYSFVILFLNRQNILLQNVYRALLLLWQRNRITSKKNFIEIQILCIIAIQKSCITIAPIITSKSKKKVATKNMARIKNIGRIQSLLWDFLWMLMASRLLLIFSPKSKRTAHTKTIRNKK